MLSLRRLLLSFGCFLLIAIKVPAQGIDTRSVTVTGNVMSEEGNHRLEGVTIRLCDSGGTEIEQSVTNSSGDFAFRHLQRGNYILTASANEYLPAEIHLDLNFASERGFTVYLKSLPKNSAPALSGSSVSSHELSLPESAREMLTSGRKALYVEKNPASALHYFEKALKKDPGCYEAEYGKGMAYLNLQNTPDAMNSFRAAIKKSEGKFGDAAIALGTLQVDQGQLAEGEKNLREGVTLSPGAWMGFYQLGKLELRAGKFAEAETSAAQARSLAPNLPQVYQLLSIIHLRQKNYPALLQDIDSYLQLDSTSAAAQRAKQVRTEVQQQLARSNPSPDAAPHAHP